VKGNRQSIVVPNKPSEIDEKQVLTVSFPSLRADDVIVPGTARFAFNLALNSCADANRTIVNNLGRAIVKKISVKLEGQEVMSLEDADIYLCYRDLWMTDKERLNAAYYGIHNDGGNTAKIRLGAGDAVTATQPNASIAASFGSRFAIPLDFEILTDHGPFYPARLLDNLSFELTFNDYGRVITSTDTTATYKISGISLEYDVVTNPDLARQKRKQYMSQIVVLFTRVLCHQKIRLNKSDETWNTGLNISTVAQRNPAALRGPSGWRHGTGVWTQLRVLLQPANHESAGCVVLFVL